MQFTGKTVEEAIELGLKELGLTQETAEITVIEKPSKGLFGIFKSKAVVEISAKAEKQEIEKEEKVEKAEKVEKTEKKKKKAEKETPKKAKKEDEKKIESSEAKSTVEFVQNILDKMDINAKAEQTEGEDCAVCVNIIAEKSSEVVGYRGEVIDAIQTLAGAERNIGKKEYEKVVVDCENYRNRRKETLISLAHKLEAKATEMRRDVILEPMSPFERRIIHTALSESATVTTNSEGQEPNRYVVIIPNDKDEFSKPYNASRNNGNHKGNGKKFSNSNRRDQKERRNGKPNKSGESKKKSATTFGTYLGNSLK